MYSPYEIREIPLSLKTCRNMVSEFLRRQDLDMEEVERYFGVFDADDRMVGGGGLSGILIKEIALSEECRGEALANTLLSRLLQEARDGGIQNPMLVTKPRNEAMFASLGFHTVAKAEKAVLMESNPRGIKSYCEKLRKIAADSAPGRPDARVGVIVMNCNPLTLGHRYLIEEAAKRVDRLYVIPVEENQSEFSTSERVGMLQAVTAGFGNVTLCPGSRYIISSATFPTYFLKEKSEGSIVQMEIDADLFRRHIAPALGATVRFVGSEPFSEITEAYNEAMQRSFADGPLKLEIVERKCVDGIPVSATRVRRHIANGRAALAFVLTPKETHPYIIAHATAYALDYELRLTPKPGLVDRHDSGSHTDMDYSTMRRSIEALEPYFVTFAKMGKRDSLPAHEEIVAAGIEAENTMMKATGGVNTHRGALFTLGLFTIAASHIYYESPSIGCREFLERLRNEVKELASGFKGAENSHGSEVCRRFGIKGVADLAREGYASVFDGIFCFEKELEDITSSPAALSEEDGLRMLLRIMSLLDDTNVFHRGGKEGSDFVKRQAAKILGNFDKDSLSGANREFIARNISPGGAADMLSLYVFVRSMLPAKTGCKNTQKQDKQ